MEGASVTGRQASVVYPVSDREIPGHAVYRYGFVSREDRRVIGSRTLTAMSVRIERTLSIVRLI